MKKLSLLSLALTLTLAACNNGAPPAPTPTQANVNGYVVNADKTVDLNVSALDAKGTVLNSGNITDPTVSGVTMTQASVQVQAVPTVTASVCSNITSVSGDMRAGILMDASGSMATSDADKKRAEAAKLFISRLGGNATAAITSFSGTAATAPYTVLTVHQNFTTDKTALEKAVDTAAVAGSGTPLWEASKELVDFTSKQSGNRVGIILTDGAANSNSELNNAIAAAKAAGIRLFLIGLGQPSDLDTADMQAAAQQTNGTYVLVNDATALNSAFNGMFNATQGAGCIKLNITPAPTPGQVITGTVNFKVNGTPIAAPFKLQY